MEKFGKLNPEEILILEFSILKGNLNSPFEHKMELVERYNYDVDFTLQCSLELKRIISEIKVDIETISSDDQEYEADGKFQLSFHFEVNNLHDLIRENEEEEKVVSPHLGNAIASITYSTARGILMTRFQGTALSNFILPIIDPNELLK